MFVGGQPALPANRQYVDQLLGSVKIKTLGVNTLRGQDLQLKGRDAPDCGIDGNWCDAEDDKRVIEACDASPAGFQVMDRVNSLLDQTGSGTRGVRVSVIYSSGLKRESFGLLKNGQRSMHWPSALKSAVERYIAATTRSQKMQSSTPMSLTLLTINQMLMLILPMRRKRPTNNYVTHFKGLR